MGCGYVLPILALVSYIFALVFNYAAVASDWFGDKDVGEVSDIYQVTITPAGWTFAIWGIIYVWQALWIVYTIILSFKKVNHGLLYFNNTFWICYIVANIINGVWIGVWISEKITFAMILLICIFVLLCLSFVSSHRWLVYEIPFKIHTNGTENELDKYPQSLILSLMNNNQSCCVPLCFKDEKQLLYSLVLNGVSLYLTWTAIASCINIAVFFRYECKFSNDTSVTVGLTLLALIVLTYWFCDFIKFKNTLRFTFTPYFVLIWAFSGILSKYSVNDKCSSIVILIFLIISIIASIYKLFDSLRLIKRNNDARAKALLV